MYEQEMEIALQAVVRASQLCEQVRAALTSGDTVTKDDRSPVTVADFGAQALIIHALNTAFPDIPIVAEEDAGLLREAQGAELLENVLRYVRAQQPEMTFAQLLAAVDGGGAAGGAEGRFWTLDPIDGTKGFIRGDQYAVALALIEDGQPVLGVLGCPHLPAGVAASSARGLVFTAIRGGGAQLCPLVSLEKHPVTVSDRDVSSQAVFCESVESGHTAQGRGGRICSRLGVVVPPVRLDSQCKYAVVARGEADVYMRLPTRADYEEKIWDHAAGVVVVEEAGGRVTDIHGERLDFSQGRTLKNNKGVLATNGRLHQAVVEAIQA